VAARGEVGNFASFLRVSALRYEALLAQGRIPADNSVAIRSLDAKAVLHELPEGWGSPLPEQARVHTLHVAARRQA